VGWHAACFVMGMKKVMPLRRARAVRYSAWVALIGATLAPFDSQADPRFHDPVDITRAAERGLLQQAGNAEVSVSPVDPRVRLPRCSQPLEATTPPSARLDGRAMVRVACRAPTPWHVNLNAEIFSEVAVVVAEKPLRPGALITGNDVRLEVRRVPGTAACCPSELGEVVGKTAKRAVTPESTLRYEFLDTPPAIRRGEMVTLIASAPGMEIRAAGIALADAQVGEPVRIRHTSSLRIVQARADTPGVARVDR